MNLSVNEHVRMHDVKVLLGKGSGWYDCVVEDGITLTRETNVAAKLSCKIRRDSITAEKNDQVILKLDNKSIFHGVIITTKKGSVWSEIEAYDQIWYLSRNEDRLGYENFTADGLVEFFGGGLQIGQLADTHYHLPYHSSEEGTRLDFILNALEETRIAKGIRYILYDDCRSLRLVEQADLAAMTKVYVFLSCIEDYSYDEDMSNISNSIIVYYTKEKDGKQAEYTAFAENSSHIQEFGRLEDIETAQEGENAQHKADQLLAERCADRPTLSITGCQGDPNVRGGTPIWVDFYTFDNAEYIRGWFRVNSVTHKFDGGFHTMDMETELIKMDTDWSKRSGWQVDLPRG